MRRDKPGGIAERSIFKSTRALLAEQALTASPWLPAASAALYTNSTPLESQP
jgi:hypothetical protein